MIALQATQVYRERTRSAIREYGVEMVLRNRLQHSDQEEFIIGLSQPPGEIAKQRDIFALRYQDVGASGVEIDADRGAQRIK